MDITPLIFPSVDRKELARVLDDVGDPVRIRAITDLGRKDLVALYEAAADNAPLTLEHYVPAGVPSMTEVIHEGKNSLGLFTRFQKRFCRPNHETNPPELWGYNEQSMRLFTGPGYFVARASPEGGVVIDYQRVPPDRPESWPPVLLNSARLSRFIYNGTVDVMRKISDHVSVGRAMRDGKPMDAWFVLARRELAHAREDRAGAELGTRA